MTEGTEGYKITVKVNQSQTEVRAIKGNFIPELLQQRKSGLTIELGTNIELGAKSKKDKQGLTAMEQDGGQWVENN